MKDLFQNLGFLNIKIMIAVQANKSKKPQGNTD